jgi:hypothetical protein
VVTDKGACTVHIINMISQWKYFVAASVPMLVMFLGLLSILVFSLYPQAK